MIDDGHAIHYTAVRPGARVFGSDGKQVGTVEEVVDNYREHILDGIVIEMEAGELRFVDGPEVSRTAERGVTLAITSAEAAKLPPPQGSTARIRVTRGARRLGRLLGRDRRRS